MNAILIPELYPVFWLILGIILGVVEAFSVQLVAIWFSLGSIAAILPAMLGAPMWVQFMVFALVSVLALFGTRPFVKKVLRPKGEHTNADRVIGQVGVVLQAIDNDAAQGRITVGGLDWAARSSDNTPIAVGERVRVLAIEGVKLIVEKKGVPQDGTGEE